MHLSAARMLICRVMTLAVRERICRGRQREGGRRRVSERLRETETGRERERGGVGAEGLPADIGDSLEGDAFSQLF